MPRFREQPQDCSTFITGASGCPYGAQRWLWFPGFANPLAIRCQLNVREGSDDKRTLRIIAGVRAHVFDPAVPVAPQEIEAQAIFLLVNLSNQPLSKGCPLPWIYKAFENRFLNPLPIAHAEPGHPLEAPAPAGGLCTNVICYQD
jgi:hypothetical protein